MQINGKFKGTTATVLREFGADPRTLFHDSEKFDLQGALMEFNTQVEYTTRRTVTADQQYDYAMDLIANPLDGNRCTFVGSYPTDARAKAFGAFLLERTWSASQQQAVRSSFRRPLWISLYNQYFKYDELAAKNPVAVFISNVTDNCTQQKMERLRDLLELFSNVPRIVMYGGKVDPITFAQTRLRYAIDTPLLIGGKNISVSLMEDY